MSKKFILSCMAMGILASGVCNNAFASNGTEQTAERQERVLTKEDANRLIEEMKARGSTELVIPEGYASIGSWAFYERTGLTSIVIPDSVESIGWYAFKGCTGLTSIVIPDSVKKIEWSAFEGCTRLTSIVIPDSVTSIGQWAFQGCTRLTSITIPDSVAPISYEAFKGCDNAKFTVPCQGMKDYLCVSHKIADNRIIVNEKLANPKNAWKWPEDGHVKIPQGVTNVDRRIFYKRTAIKSITIPDSVTSIGFLAFAECTGLTEITIPDSVESIGNSAFEGCTGLTSITIPDSVTSIGYEAFKGCTGLTSITIPDSVASIGYEAFKGCDNAKITVPSQGMKDYLCVVHKIADNRIIVNEKLANPQNAWKWPEDGHVKIPQGVTDVDDLMFYKRTAIKSITIPDSVKSIGRWAFKGCTWLKSIDLKNVKCIGKEAFRGCIGLTSIVIPDSVESIGDSAFEGCKNLNKVFVYSDRVKDLVINSKSEIAPGIIEIIEKPTDTNSYQQIVEEQELRMQALDAEIANLLANNPVTKERARIKREAEEGYGLELDNDSVLFDDTEIYEQSRLAYETYKQNEKEIAKKRLRLAKIRESLAKKGGK